MSVAPCANCMMKSRYEQKPRSILGRLWRWHTKWCPGWKSYMRSLSDEERREVQRKLDEAQQRSA